jgi:hypothetical protein
MWQKAIGDDGVEYDSASEARIANWLLAHDVTYEPHKHLPSPSTGICDFYLPDVDLWVEYDGLMEVRKDKKLVTKKRFYADHGLKFLVITRQGWQDALYDAILGS